RLLRAAIVEGPAHAYLFYGPPGVGKRTAALAFAAELIGDGGRVARRAHPDLYVVEPVGDQIRIDDIRELRRDLHMRPFEAARRVYLLYSAETMNEDAADALLKDLEEPPLYAVIVLVADDLGPLPEAIRSRCQLVPFRRLSERALREVGAAPGPGPAAGRGARRAAGVAGGARRMVPRSRRQRRRCGRGRSPRRPGSGARRRRDGRAARGGRARLRARARDLAGAGGVQSQCGIGTRGPVRPTAPRARRPRRCDVARASFRADRTLEGANRMPAKGVPMKKLLLVAAVAAARAVFPTAAIAGPFGGAVVGRGSRSIAVAS